MWSRLSSIVDVGQSIVGVDQSIADAGQSIVDVGLEFLILLLLLPSAKSTGLRLYT